jgi:two-component system response regulator RegX3
MGELWQSSRIGSVLVASAFPGRAGTMAYAFSRHGIVPTLVFSTAELGALVERTRFDLVMIDGGLPGIEDPALVRTIVRRSDAAVILVGGSDAVGDVLAAGAHVQLGAGVTPDEVALRGSALVGLRPGTQHSPTLEWGPLRLDMRRREAQWNGRRVELTRLEIRILAALVVAAGGVVTREDLYRMVWRQAAPDDGERIVAHIRRIRAKLETDPTHPTFLLTARGEGFRLADPPDTSHEELRSA